MALPLPSEITLPCFPDRLVQLLSCSSASPANWSAADWSDILSHQLAAPLLFDLEQLSPTDRELLRDCTIAGACPASFGQILTHAAPPVGLLVLIKDYAKGCDQDADGALPSEVASALYYAAIFAARVRRGVRISSLDDAALVRAARWGTQAEWIVPELKELFRSGLEILG